MVVVLRFDGEAALVAVQGFQPFWIEASILEKTGTAVGAPTSTSSVPLDYLEWMRLGMVVPFRSRRPAKGGALVLVRAEKDKKEPWRWVGQVFRGGELCLLLVDPTVPYDQVLDVSEDQICLVPTRGKKVADLLLAL